MRFGVLLLLLFLLVVLVRLWGCGLGGCAGGKGVRV